MNSLNKKAYCHGPPFLGLCPGERQKHSVTRKTVAKQTLQTDVLLGARVHWQHLEDVLTLTVDMALSGKDVSTASGGSERH